MSDQTKWPEHGFVAQLKKQLDDALIRELNAVQERDDANTAKAKLEKEVDRLRELLRSMPRSFGINERDITGGAK